MQLSIVLQLVALGSAFVLPDQDFFASLEPLSSKPKDTYEPSISHLLDTADHVADQVSAIWHKASQEADIAAEDIVSYTSETREDIIDTYSESKEWAESFLASESPDTDLDPWDEDEGFETDRPRHGHRGRKHRSSNYTVYELISKSKYTTKLAKLVNDFPDLVDALNKTEANYTVFAPTNVAFEKIPKHAPKPSKDFLKNLLLYHVSSDFYPAGRVLAGRTIPTLLTSENLSDDEVPQRLATQINLRGLTVNGYSRIVAINVFGSNGVIHGVDSLIIPPPPALKIIEFFPEEFSTLELGLYKTGLMEGINTTEHKGGTLFAPSNWAFRKLGVRTNAFLFSGRGLKYLRALLKYHVVPEKTMYSDHYIEGHPSKETELAAAAAKKTAPRGYKHFDLPTMLEDRSLSVDIFRYGRLITIRVNGFADASFLDAVAQDGVIHKVSSVIFPPWEREGVMEEWDGEREMSVEELVQRLEPFVDEDFLPVEL